jgi:prevent-host-death family protein
MSVLVNVHAAKTQLSRLLDAAAAGEEVIIAKAGKPVARLVPITAVKQPRRLGTLAGKLHVPDDFDDPLPDDIIAQFEGR